MTITQQPAINSLNSAYRPIVIKGTFPVLTGTINKYSVTIDNNGNKATISPVPLQTIGIGTLIKFNGTLVADVTVLTTINLGAAVIVTFSQVLQPGTFKRVALTVNSVLSTYTGALPPPPVIFCDVYVNGDYYKSITTTSSGFNPVFDIQDAVRERLKVYLVPSASSAIRAASPLFATCFGRIRGSSTDLNGFLVVEQPAPIQATGDVPAVSGGGTLTHTFVVVNAALQHEDDQDLATHLNLYKTRTWDTVAFPLSHRNNRYRVANSDYFPIVNLNALDLTKIKINYILLDGTVGNAINTNVFPVCPVVGSITATPSDNGNGVDQTFTFNWDIPDPLLTAINVLYTPTGGSVFVSVPVGVVSGQTLILPLGKYDFKFEMTGSCTTSTSSLTSNVGIAAPACVPPTHASPSMPDGFVGVPYSFDLPITGSTPLTIGTITKPSWMTLTPVGGMIQFRGTPTATVSGQSIAVTVTNACGNVTFTDTINITNLARTLTFSFLPTTSGGGNIYDLQSLLKVELNGPVDSLIIISSFKVSGRSSSDCSGSELATSSMINRTLNPGDTVVTANDAPMYQWGFCHSYHVSEAKIRLDLVQINPQSIFPGQVIMVGSYSVTIIFQGC